MGLQNWELRKSTAHVELMPGFRLFVCFTLHNKRHRFCHPILCFSCGLLCRLRPFLWFVKASSQHTKKKKKNKGLVIMVLCRLFLNQSTVATSPLNLLHYLCHIYVTQRPVLSFTTICSCFSLSSFASDFKHLRSYFFRTI